MVLYTYIYIWLNCFEQLLRKLKNFLKKRERERRKILKSTNETQRFERPLSIVPNVLSCESLSLPLYLFSRHPNATYIASTIIYQLYRRLQQRYYNIGGTIRLVSSTRLKISIVGFLDTVITLSIWYVMQFIFFPYWLCLRYIMRDVVYATRSFLAGNNTLEIMKEKISHWVIEGYVEFLHLLIGLISIFLRFLLTNIRIVFRYAYYDYVINEARRKRSRQKKKYYLHWTFEKTQYWNNINRRTCRSYFDRKEFSYNLPFAIDWKLSLFIYIVKSDFIKLTLKKKILRAFLLTCYIFTCITMEISFSENVTIKSFDISR